MSGRGGGRGSGEEFWDLVGWRNNLFSCIERHGDEKGERFFFVGIVGRLYCCGFGSWIFIF